MYVDVVMFVLVVVVVTTKNKVVECPVTFKTRSERSGLEGFTVLVLVLPSTGTPPPSVSHVASSDVSDRHVTTDSSYNQTMLPHQPLLLLTDTAASASAILLQQVHAWCHRLHHHAEALHCMPDQAKLQCVG
jgi:hypothetical protein